MDRKSLVALAVVVAVATATTTAYNYQHELLIDSSNGVLIRWKLTETELQMQMEATVSGYVAMGWSDSGRMAPSFVVFGSADAAPVELIIVSTESSGISPAPDQPLQNASASTTDGRTAITFTRALRHATRPITVGADTTMIWAVHATYRGIAKHTAQGAFVVNLSTGVGGRVVPPLLVTHD